MITDFIKRSQILEAKRVNVIKVETSIVKHQVHRLNSKVKYLSNHTLHSKVKYLSKICI